MRLALSLAVLLCVYHSAANAAAPDVKSVFPLGARVGSTLGLAATGNLALPGTRVWSNNSALSFELPESGSTCKVTVSTEAAPGLCWLRFFNSEGASGLVPFIVGTLPESNETEPNNTVDKAHKLDGSAVLNAKLAEAGDVDVFAIPVTAGQTLVAAVDANRRLGSPVDAIIQVLGPNGAVIEQNDDDQDNDPLIALKADRDGMWYVRVFGFPAAPNSSVRYAGGADYRYRLTVTTGAFANHSVPSLIGGSGQQPIELIGWNLTPDIAPVTVNAPKSGECGALAIANTVPIKAFDGPIVVEQEPNDAGQPGEIAIDGVVCGVIGDPRDEDAFRFRATKGQKLELTVESHSLGHPLDPVLRIQAADGKVVAESDDTNKEPDPSLKFTPSADGEFTVVIRDAFRNGGWRFAYRLYCRQIVPAVSLSVKTDNFKVESGKPLEIPVTVTRVNGFAEEVEVGISGTLPSGVTCEPVKSASKGDTAGTVKLTLNTDGSEAGSGVIQIVGSYRQADKKAITLATFAIPNSSSTIDELWLTAVKKP